MRTAASLVSSGTEKMAMDFAGKSLLQKARSRPDLVRQVVTKAKAEGVANAVGAALNRLDRPQSLGYSAAGIVVAVGEGVSEFAPGDRVACAGAGYAVHAEFIVVPRNLVAHVPQGEREVTFEEAAFTAIGAIALHAFRLAEPTLGETVAVIGLGLIGLVTAQIAHAAGCKVVGIDPNQQRCGLAEQLGCSATADESTFKNLIAQATSGRGADVVLITAATDSDAPVTLAGEAARLKGRVVAAGLVGTNIPRRLYFDKELDFRISRSYGPGRYDPEFEELGHDYPAAYVRWTETRNMQAFLELLASSRVQVLPLISHRFPIDRATEAYDLISGETGAPFLGVVIAYPADAPMKTRVDLAPAVAAKTAETVRIGVIGAGNFANAVLLPALKHLPSVQLAGICAGSGASARHVGDKFGFRYCATSEKEILDDPAVDAVVIATRHDSHARQVIAALEAGKHVFVEKPLAIREDELRAVAAAAQSSGRMLMVGFNRRFAPLAQRMKEFFRPVQEPLMVQYRANAGRIPLEHWTQHPEQGGRIIGEACHFVDFSGWMIGENPVSVSAEALPDHGIYRQDNVVLTLRYPNGSIAVVTYIAAGDKLLGKERVEVHGGGRSAVLDDFREVELSDGRSHRKEKARFSQDKGHAAECEAFVSAVLKGGPSPIPFADLYATTEAMLLAVQSLGTDAPAALVGTPNG